MTPLQIAPAYRPAIKVALVGQLISLLFLMTILDGGQTFRAATCGMAGFWIGVAIVMMRRPRSPSALDLLFVRWGFLPMLALGIALLPWLGVLRR